MGQGGSLSENRSLILGNWAQTQPASNIFFNKVTNQQIQRYEVVINEKNQLSSYSARMQDQSGLICRLIYFHPRSLPKQDRLKKQHMKTFTGENATNNRPKSMLSEHVSLNQTQPTLKNNQSSHQQDANPKIYCIYTDRMIPIKQWNRDKIIDVITAFKKLTKIYGMFKVRQRCICENERKEVKVWINQNPISNFPVDYVESEEDMIADFAAILVSKKEKIAKEMLDLQFFDQAIDHFSKLTEYEQKKYFSSSSSSNTASHRQSNTPNMSKQMDKNHPLFTLPSQVNNFYNVYINTDNSFTVNSSMQNSKLNIINQGNFPYSNSNFTQASNNKQTPTKHQQNQDHSISLSQKYKTSNNIENLSINRQYSVPNFMQVHLPSYSQTPGFVSLSKDHQFSKEHYSKNLNLKLQKQNPNQISINKVIEKNKKNQNFTTFDLSNPKIQQNNHFMDNTSIMIQTNQKTSESHNNLHKSQKGNKETNKNDHQTMKNLQRKHLNTQSNQSTYFNFIQNSKNPSKYTPSTSNDLKNRAKNNSSGDIQLKKNLQPQPLTTNLSFIQSNKKDTTEENSSKIYDKKFFSGGGNQISTNQSYLKPQVKKVSQFQQKSIDQGRLSEGQNIKYLQKNKITNQNISQSDLASILVCQSKLFVKSGLPNQSNKAPTDNDQNKTMISQMSTLKPPNLQNYNSANNPQLNKKSFPKYFHEKQTAKSIQKYYQKSLQKREKSIILTSKNGQEKSSKKFGQQKFEYKNSQGKGIMQDKVIQFNQQETTSKQIQYITQKFSNSNEGFIRSPKEVYQPRKKFPSTIESKSNRIAYKKSLQQKQYYKNKFGMSVDSQSSYMQSHQATKSNFMDVNGSGQDHEKILKKSNNTCIEGKSQKPKTITNSYFNAININSSLLVSRNPNPQKKSFQSDITKRKQFQSIDKTQQQKLLCQMDEINQNLNEKDCQSYVKVQSFENTFSGNFNPNQNQKQIAVTIDDSNRKHTFPHYQQNSHNSRKNQKQFTFFNPSQKLSGLIQIEEINPFQPSHQKNRMNVFKKQSIKSYDEKQTLPRTTADERQKRMFKATRTSQIIFDANDLHSSDPGHRIQQIVQTLQKQKQRNMTNNDTVSLIQQKIDNKQHSKFKKWQPSVNIYGSLINPTQQGSTNQKKDYSTKSEKNNKNQQPQTSKQTQTEKDQQQQIYPEMSSSDNLQTKKKIRKQVFMDYKGLFGDENPFLKQQSAQQKQRAKKLQIKKLREQQERLLQNASSKDLLIQQKVQKQKLKHAQLKNDLSKLFSDEF